MSLQQDLIFSKYFHPNDLAHHNCLLFTYELGANIWQFRRDTEVCQVSVTGSLASNHSEVLRQVSLDGAGLVLADLVDQ